MGFAHEDDPKKKIIERSKTSGRRAESNNVCEHDGAKYKLKGS